MTNVSSWRATLLTLYPEMFPGSLSQSLAGRALEKGVWGYDTLNIRDHGIGKHRKVDDPPFGGGAGLVMRADCISNSLNAHIAPSDPRRRIYMSPRGKPLTQSMVHDFAAEPGLIILCGRFEGVDERVLQAERFEEISIGDYVLSGGEPAALILMDAVIRLLPGVMGSEQSETQESFENGLLEYPHYTKPRDWNGLSVPNILTSGDHGAIAKWRDQKSLELTTERRPDLIAVPKG